MEILNSINKLSKDYRLVLLAALIAALLSFIIMQLPGWMTTSLFWEFSLTVVVISVISLVAQFYYYSRKLTKK